MITHTTPRESPDILVLGGFPVGVDVDRGAFTSNMGYLVRNIIQNLTRTLPRNQIPSVQYAFAVRCVPESTKFKLKIDIINQCRPHLMNLIEGYRPKVVLALGADTLKALELRETLKDVRGVMCPRKFGEHGTIVLPTLHPNTVLKSPGFTTVLERDIRKAIRFVNEDLSEHALQRSTPTQYEDVISELLKVKAAIANNWEATGKPLLVTVDTETTSLLTYDPKFRMIVVTLSYAEKVGLAFPWDHRESVFTEAQRHTIRLHLQDILADPRVFLAEHNSKFDQQGLQGHEKLETRPVGWDTLLVEHLLDEDKKGEYSLKTLTQDYFPGMGKYEVELHQHLDAIKAERVALYKEKVAEFKAYLRETYVTYWTSLEEPERLRKSADWVNQGWLAMSDCKDIISLKLKKMKGQMVLTKKYATAVHKVLAKLPEGAISLPEIQPPDESIKEVTFEDAPIDVLLRYATVDSIVTRMLVREQFLGIQLDEQLIKATSKTLGRILPTRPLKWAMDNLTMPMSRVITKMEYGGVRLDREKTRQFIGILEDEIVQAEQDVFSSYGKKFNINSTDALVKVLFEDLKLPVVKQTDTGQPSTDADTIKYLADTHPEIPFLDVLLNYRKMGKVKSTYLENWLKMSELDGKIHCSFNQNGTATYRLSSSKPNLQNVPFYLKLRQHILEKYKDRYPQLIKDKGLNLKSLFLPDEGFEFYDLDIANAEMRVLTAYSRDAALIEVFLRDMCMHCLTGSGISSFTYEDILAHKEDKASEQYRIRQVAKKTNFGTIYVMQGSTLQKKLWEDMRIKVTEEEANEYLAGFFKKYPEVKTYIDTTINFTERFLFTFTFTGRRRRFPIANYSRKQRKRMGRQAVNARIQTTSSDLVQTNMIDLDPEVEALGGRILLSVHDSAPFQLPIGTTGVKPMLDRVIMGNIAEKYPWLPVPWKYDVGKGPSYGEAKLAVA